MDIKSIAQQMHSYIQQTIPTSVVSVVYGSQTASGTAGPSTTVVDQEIGLDMGSTISSVHVKANELNQPEHGDRITVDGVVVYVVSSRVDSQGALRYIEYSKSRPVSGVNML